MTLKDWLSRGRLKRQPSSREEISAILRKIDRDLIESGKADISLDWRLVIAYNAALGCAMAALRASGYRVNEGGGNHIRTIDSLHFTLGLERELIIALHAVRKKRHSASYDAAGTVSKLEVNETIELAEELKVYLIDWLKNNHPELL
jgi:hypothetical protein